MKKKQEYGYKGVSLTSCTMSLGLSRHQCLVIVGKLILARKKILQHSSTSKARCCTHICRFEDFTLFIFTYRLGGRLLLCASASGFFIPEQSDCHYTSQSPSAPEDDIVIAGFDGRPRLCSASSRLDLSADACRAENKTRFELARKKFLLQSSMQRGIDYIIHN